MYLYSTKKAKQKYFGSTRFPPRVCGERQRSERVKLGGCAAARVGGGYGDLCRTTQLTLEPDTPEPARVVVIPVVKLEKK